MRKRFHSLFSFRNTPDSLARAVVAQAREGILITDHKRKILQVNQAYRDILGCTDAQILGRQLTDFFSPKVTSDKWSEIFEALRTEGRWQGDLLGLRCDNTEFIQETGLFTVPAGRGQREHIALMAEDVTRDREMTAAAEFQANHDALTNLPNRRYLMEYLNTLVNQKEPVPFQLGILDLDNFKKFNDAYGHSVGDNILHSVVERLSSLAGEGIFQARLEGDEFCLVIENQAEEGGLQEDPFIPLLEDFQSPFQVVGLHNLFLNCTIGVVCYPDDDTTPLGLIDKANLALHHGKKKRKGQVCFYQSEMSRPIKQRMAHEVALRDSLRNEEIVVHYQPKLNMETKRISGVEALVRWHKKTGEEIPPDEFIGIAEETGMIIDIGAHVLLQACRDIVRLNKELGQELVVAVNISGVQFSDPNLFRTIKSALEMTGLPPRLLEVEITETIAMSQLGEASSVLNQIRALGVSVAMDDFGTGYSSLAYLKNYPLDVLKIDKSFVDYLPEAREDSGIVEAILTLSHLLKLKVVVEGVEQPEQLKFLASAGCQEIQGFLLSKPLSIEDLINLVSRFQYEDWQAKFLLR